MSATLIEPILDEADVTERPRMSHYVCISCNDMSFCGTKSKNGDSYEDELDADCVVCDDLWKTLRACPHCGGDPW